METIELIKELFIYWIVIFVYFSFINLEIAIVCVINGYKINNIAILGINIYNGKQGRKVSFSFKYIFGMVIYYCEEEKDKKNLLFVLMIVHGITGLLSAFLIYSYSNPWIDIDALLVGVCFATIAIISLYIKRIRLMNGNSTEKEMMQRCMYFENKTLAGVRPGELNMQPINPQAYRGMSAESKTVKAAAVMDYRQCLDRKDFPKMQDYINLFMYFAEITDTNRLRNSLSCFYELIYFFAVIDPHPDLAEKYYQMVEKYLVKDKDCNGRRVYAAYCYGVLHDRNKALALIEEGVRKVPYYMIAGNAVMEESLLYELRERCRTNS